MAEEGSNNFLVEEEEPNYHYESESVIENGWFREINVNWDGYSICLKSEEVLFQGKSKFQDVLVFRSKSWGNILVLNGIVQCTERDEFTYQEMITHIPMTLHKNPQKVLVIGGGDGGVVREVLKHTSVEQVVLCEIDQMVLDVSKKFLPGMAKSLSDPRVRVHVGDGIEFVRDHTNEYDVIITDSSDPEGAGLALFQKQYYSELYDCLREDGVACCQGETLFLDLSMITSVVTQCREIFPNVGYAVGNVPTYPTGLIGYLLAAKNPKLDLKQPVRRLSDEDLDRMDLKYYTPDVHTGAFALPNYARRALKSVIDSCT